MSFLKIELRKISAMNVKNRILITCVFVFAWLFSTAQPIQISIIPGSDYTFANRAQWQVLVTNSSGQTIRTLFHGLVTEAQDGIIYEVRSEPRDILPGTTTFSTNYFVGLDPFTVINENLNYQNYAIQTNGLPAGDYEICITAFSFTDQSELGTNCYQYSVDHFSPPVLVSPEDRDTVSQDFPFFTWLPPAPTNGKNFTYTLFLYEMQNKQTPVSAVQLNPAYYEKKGIGMTMAQYGINARKLRQGMRYAWKVSAELNNQTVATSEVWSFVFWMGPSVGELPDKPSKPEPKNKRLLGIPYLELEVDVKADFSVLDRGLLSFRYEHKSTTPTAGLRILNMNGQMVFSKRLEVNNGSNYFSAPVSEYGSLKVGEVYELQVVDMNGNIRKQRFKIVP